MKINSGYSIPLALRFDAPRPCLPPKRAVGTWKTRVRRFVFAGLLHLTLVGLAHAGPNGPDTSFAGTGAKRLGFGFGDDFASAVTVQPDGKVLVAGSSTAAFLGFGGSGIAVVRYGTNDLLDPSFGQGGKVTTAASTDTNATAAAAAIQVQRDGKIVVAGTLNAGTNEFALLVRYHPDGSLDDSFGQGGMVTNFFNEGGQGDALVIQSDGKIVLGGSARNGFGSDFALARYDTNGVLDASFGGTGIVTDGVGIVVNGMAVQSDGKIIAVGWGGNYDFAVFRYTPGGVLDIAFGPDHTGRVITHLGGFSDFSRANAVAIEPGDNLQTLDRIVVGGYTEVFNPPQFEVVRYAIDGSLDTTFGGTGVVTVPVGTGFFNVANSVVIQGTGTEPRKIILAGYSSGNFENEFCALRFNDDGTLDNAFDGDGKVYTSFGSDQDVAAGATLVPGGKLLIVGSTLVNQNNDDFALARYHLSDGSLDTSFNDDGKMTQDIGERPAQAKAIAIQTDGKIVVAGSSVNGINYGPEHSVALTRLDPDGGVDMSFGHFGKTTVTLGEADSVLNAMAIQPDGRIVAAGFTGTNFLVARFTTNGMPDTSFNGSGIATPQIAPDGNIATATAVQPDGKIVIAGGIGFNGNLAVVRFNTDSTLDASFDGDGKLTIDFGAGLNLANAVKIQPDGRILIAGYAVVGSTTVDFAAVRLLTNGVADSSFGTFGAVLTELGSGRSEANAMALQSDGKILLAGPVVIGPDIQFAVVRYETNGVLDTTFDGDGKVITPIGLVDDEPMAIGVQSDGKIVVGGNVRVVGHPQFAVIRYNSDGALDTSFGAGGKAFVDFQDNTDNNLFALALDANGRVVVAGDAGGFFGVARMQGDPVLNLQSIERLGNGPAVLQGVGIPNQTYMIQASSNLLPGSFSTLGQASANATGLWQFEDASATNLLRRFYRLAIP